MMEVTSKLARQIAYKKKLEEEYRLAEERKKVGKLRKYSGYEFREGERRNWEDDERQKRSSNEEDTQREMDIQKQKEKQNYNS